MLMRFGQSGPWASTLAYFVCVDTSFQLLVLGYVLLESSALDFFSQLYCSITEDCFLRVLYGVSVHTRALPFPGQSAMPQAPRSGGQGLGWTGVSPLAELRRPCKLHSLPRCLPISGTLHG